jgi:hypothetical protein
METRLFQRIVNPLALAGAIVMCEPTGHLRLPFDRKVPPQHRLEIWRDHRQDIV